MPHSEWGEHSERHDRGRANDVLHLRLVILGISTNDILGLLGCVIPLLVADGIVNGLQRGLVARHLGGVTKFVSNRHMTPQDRPVGSIWVASGSKCRS